MPKISLSLQTALHTMTCFAVCDIFVDNDEEYLKHTKPPPKLVVALVEYSFSRMGIR